jgi:oxygen-independent coproporphyrinogen-3 oxidase
MVECIIKEIYYQVPFSQSEKIETIYFGGGTPSLLEIQQVAAILETIHTKFKVADDAEITFEVNPENVSPVVLKQWQHTGINRLSVGIQTFVEEELRWMNRAHDADRAIRCLAEINDAGFTNFSADLIYGSPFLNNNALEENVKVMLKYNVPHLSCYALTVEKNTALYNLMHIKKTVNVNDQHQSDQFLWLMKNLPLAGYEQYEISNFARAGKRSKHNSSYWKGKPYYGFGPSAHSYNGTDIRRWNISNNSLYIQTITDNLPYFEEEVLTSHQRLNEYVMISLRTREGLDTNYVTIQFGQDQKNRILEDAEKYIRENKLLLKENFLQLTDEGKVFADGIASDLFV